MFEEWEGGGWKVQGDAHSTNGCPTEISAPRLDNSKSTTMFGDAKQTFKQNHIQLIYNWFCLKQESPRRRTLRRTTAITC